MFPYPFKHIFISLRRYSILSALLLTSVYALGAPPELERVQDPTSCELLLRSDDRQELRNHFVSQYGSKVYVSELENSDWIQRIYSKTSNSKFYVAIENSALKSLNDDIIRDKDLVTALTNFHKEILLYNLNRYLAKDRFKIYSDFKSVRLEILEAPSSEDLTAIEKLFLKTNNEFYTNPYLKKILREEDFRDRGWFTMGTGFSEGEATIAARGARQSPTRILHFSNQSFQTELSTKLSLIKSLHPKIAAKIDLTLDVFIHCRKTKEPHQLLENLREEFPHTNLDLSLANQLATFCATVDEFSPSLLTPGREIITLDQVPYGVMALDFIGLGAENLKATAEKLLAAQDLRDALYLTRHGEREVTEKFLVRKEKVREIVREHFHGQVSIRFSGDDAIILPEREFNLQDQLFLLRKLSQMMPYPFFRMSTILTSNREAHTSALMISQAEAIEKSLRPLIRKNLGADIAKGIHINVFNTKVEKSQKVFLVLKLSVKLNSAQIQTLYSIFEKAVSGIESDISEQGSEISISTGDIFSI